VHHRHLAAPWRILVQHALAERDAAPGWEDLPRVGPAAALLKALDRHAADGPAKGLSIAEQILHLTHSLIDEVKFI